MRLGVVIGALIALGAAAFFVYRSGGADFLEAQSRLAAISEEDWARGVSVAPIVEDVSPTALLLLAQMGNTRAQVAAGAALLDGAYDFPLDLTRAIDLLEKAASKDDPRAQLSLALALARRTPEHEPDMARARQLIDSANAIGAPAALPLLALQAMGGLESGRVDMNEALRLLTDAYDKRVPLAAYLISTQAWRTGRWSTGPQRLAALREAADQGSHAALFDLAKLYISGVAGAIEPDESIAVTMLERASRAGNAQARELLGTAYVTGQLGLTQDREAGMQLIERAAGQGLASSQYILAVDLRETDPERSTRLLQSSAAQNNAKAMYEIGRCHSNGECGFAEDETEASRWYLRAADAGNERASMVVGIMYQMSNGPLGPRNAERALHYLRQGASGNDPDGLFNLADFLFRNGPYQDIATAIRLMRQAADRGHTRAASEIGTIYHSGLYGVPRDEARAFRYFNASSEEPFSQAGLAVCYYYGRCGASRDRARGIALMQRVANSDVEELANLARQNLREWRAP